MLFLIFAGVLIYTHKESFPLFRYSMVIVTCFYLILSFGHPDYWIAKVNVESMQENRSDFFKGEAYDDYRYLATLNADAAPVLLKLLDDRKYDLNYYYICEESDECYSKSSEIGFGYCWLEYMHERTEDMSLRKFNVSRFLMEQNLLGRVTEGM